jgi:hypothetical protein
MADFNTDFEPVINVEIDDVGDIIYDVGTNRPYETVAAVESSYLPHHAQIRRLIIDDPAQPLSAVYKSTYRDEPIVTEKGVVTHRLRHCAYNLPLRRPEFDLLAMRVGWIRDRELDIKYLNERLGIESFQMIQPPKDPRLVQIAESVYVLIDDRAPYHLASLSDDSTTKYRIFAPTGTGKTWHCRNAGFAMDGDRLVEWPTAPLWWDVLPERDQVELGRDHIAHIMSNDSWMVAFNPNTQVLCELVMKEAGSWTACWPECKIVLWLVSPGMYCKNLSTRAGQERHHLQPTGRHALDNYESYLNLIQKVIEINHPDGWLTKSAVKRSCS